MKMDPCSHRKRTDPIKRVRCKFFDVESAPRENGSVIDEDDGEANNEINPAEAIETVSEWVNHLCSSSSLHGFSWYTRTENRYFKGIILLTCVSVLLALPVVLVIKMVEFSSSSKQQIAVEWDRADVMPYPNITVCHPKYFDTRLMAGLNMSSDVANYLSFVTDPFSGYRVKRMTDDDMPYKTELLEAIDRQEAELQEVLKTNNMTILQLFKAIAIKCSKFVSYCEVHRQFMISDDPLAPKRFPRCCGTFFDTEPIFTSTGVCFTSKMKIVETYPSSLSSVKIWLNTNMKNTPVYSIMMKGTDAGERSGITWAISNADHPGAVLMKVPKRAQSNSATYVTLKMSKHDRSQLPEKCQERNETFERLFGVGTTRLNCDLARAHFIVPNCSVAVYLGFKEIPGRPPCQPKDMFFKEDSNPLIEAVESGMSKECLKVWAKIPES